MNKRQRKKYAKMNGTYVDLKETWNLDCTIAKFIVPRLKLFKKVVDCYPGHLDSMDEWYEIIDKMIYSFTYYTEDYHTDFSDPDWKEKTHYIQYHPDDNNIWSYMQSQGHSCDCGSKYFHYEENNERIEAHCNACGKLIGEPFTEDRCKIIRSEGIWR